MLNQFRRTVISYVQDSLFVRSLEAEALLEDFFVAAVASVLGIRLYLSLTGFPEVAPSGLHIAHMLWGGLFMVAALLLLLTALGRTERYVAAVLGGIGLGAFIDELGKFITQDHNYFFQPTVALIYITFILIFLFIKALTQYGPRSDRERLANAVELVKQSIIEDLDPFERERAYELLAECDKNDPLVRDLYTILDRMKQRRPRRRHLSARLRTSFQQVYQRLVRKPWFTTAVIGLFLLQSVTTLTERIALVEWSLGLGLWLGAGGLLLLTLVTFRRAWPSSGELAVSGGILAVLVLMTWALVLNLQGRPLSFIEWGQLIFPTVSSVLVVVGVAQFVRSRLNGLRMFERAVLISILLTQVYTFYTDHFVALGGLAINVLILLTLRYMIEREGVRLENARHASARSNGRPATGMLEAPRTASGDSAREAL